MATQHNTISPKRSPPIRATRLSLRRIGFGTNRCSNDAMKPARLVARRSCGFTLIELLVVIAVIGILASILIPSLKRAKASAMSAACKNNLRQIGVALRLYVDDFSKYPIYGLDYYTNDNKYVILSWDSYFLAPY